MAGIRNSVIGTGSRLYEGSRAIHEYLFFHYAHTSPRSTSIFFPHPTLYDSMKHAFAFTSRIAQLCDQYKSNNHRALDLGCSVGGSSFELTKYFTQVVGVDYSEGFISAANTMKQDGKMNYTIQKQGKIMIDLEAVLPHDVIPDNVQFYHGDACNLNKELHGTFDAILASNLLCRLPKPIKFLADITHFLNKDGVLVLISPYSWLEEFTPEEEWVGGRLSTMEGAEGQALESSHVIKSLLESQVSPLTLVHEEEVPFLIREHERKFQYGVSHCMIWKKII